MDALILYGQTGGGHQGAARALTEELERCGHTVTLLDPYELVSHKLGEGIGNVYIGLVRIAPRLFGAIYQLGELYRRLPVHSPVYAVNRRMVDPMRAYLKENHFDVIFCLHPFPGEILTCVKNAGAELPLTLWVATDYTCIPFTEEIDADYYVIASPSLTEEYRSYGLDPAKIMPFGIPVRGEFRSTSGLDHLPEELKSDPDRRGILLMGGSIGAGKLARLAALLQKSLDANPDRVLIIICGNNQRLRRKLSSRYAGRDQVVVLGTTDHLGEYMRSSAVLITKPGGLTSTEAAVCGIPLIHAAHIPGCETGNMRFFSEHGLSVCFPHRLKGVPRALEELWDTDLAARMVRAQKDVINARAAEEICRFAETHLRCEVPQERAN